MTTVTPASSDSPILVTSATGKQGGATVRAGSHVRQDCEPGRNAVRVPETGTPHQGTG